MSLADRRRYPIHDLFITPLEVAQVGGTARLRLLGHSDHLLRRFGEAEVLRVQAGTTCGPYLRPIADDLWMLESGEAELFWRDDRLGSPSLGSQHRLLAQSPLLWLVPFGVAFGVRSIRPCVIVRLSTHETEGRGGAAEIAWPEDW
jgi:hypothetical protein